MAEHPNKFEDYFSHLKKISLSGKIYKKFVSSPILFFCARKFGRRVVEIGSGTGSGVLGTYPKSVHGLEINPIAVEYCKSIGLSMQLIKEGEAFLVGDGAFDICILDNMLQHIEDPRWTLDEYYRITQGSGGLVIAVPSVRGFESDDDHKKFYDVETLKILDDRWLLQGIFSTLFLFSNEKLSRVVKQYCLVAINKKIAFRYKHDCACL